MRKTPISLISVYTPIIQETRPVLAVKALKPSDLRPSEKVLASSHPEATNKTIAPLAKPEKSPLPSPTVGIVSPLIKTNGEGIKPAEFDVLPSETVNFKHHSFSLHPPKRLYRLYLR